MRNNPLVLRLLIIVLSLTSLFTLLHLSGVNNIFGTKMYSKEVAISERLAEADANWRRGLNKREELEGRNLIDPNDPWNYAHGISIWDLFYPTFDCPHTVERIGNVGDGGKWICGFSHLAKKKEPCIVYSYGVSSETSFETEVVARTNCYVYLFDHTIDITKVNLVKLHPERVFIEKLGLGAGAINDTNPQLRSIHSTMKMYGHTFIDILKMDVEGAEFRVFDNIKTDFPDALPFGQVAMEIHLSDDAFQKDKTWLTNLESMGLRPFRNEFNFLFIRHYYYPRLAEFSFINIKLDNYLLHAQ